VAAGGVGGEKEGFIGDIALEGEAVVGEGGEGFGEAVHGNAALA